MEGGSVGCAGGRSVSWRGGGGGGRGREGTRGSGKSRDGRGHEHGGSE